jgi:hypothetical protein
MKCPWMLVYFVGVDVESRGDLRQCWWLPKGTGPWLTFTEGATGIISFMVGRVIGRWSEVTSVPVTEEAYQLSFGLEVQTRFGGNSKERRDLRPLMGHGLSLGLYQLHSLF